MFDRQLEKNPEQYQAVQHIVAGSSKPAPYLIFGPPGTGTGSQRLLPLCFWAAIEGTYHKSENATQLMPFLCFLFYSGKTVTVVEAIKQIEKTQANCYILACTPTNSAADLLCKRILEHVDKRKVYRMYASSWDPKLVPDELMVSAGSSFNENDLFFFFNGDAVYQETNSALPFIHLWY